MSLKAAHVQGAHAPVESLVDFQPPLAVRAVSLGRAERQHQPWREQTSGGVLPGKLLLVLLKAQQRFQLGASGVFFRSCSWKN